MLVRLVLVAALIEFGPKISDIECRSRSMCSESSLETHFSVSERK